MIAALIRRLLGGPSDPPPPAAPAIHRGREICAGTARLGAPGPVPRKLFADEAMRCFGVVQGARA